MVSGRDGGQCCFSSICVQSAAVVEVLAFKSDSDVADVDDDIDAVTGGVDDADEVDKADVALAAEGIALQVADGGAVADGVCDLLFSSTFCDN